MKGPISAWMNVELAGIWFKYHYFPGPQNVIADALSRFPVVCSEITGFHGATAIWTALLDRLPVVTVRAFSMAIRWPGHEGR